LSSNSKRISCVCGWLDGEVDAGEKAAEESPPDEEVSAAARWVVTVELDGVEEWMEGNQEGIRCIMVLTL
jgi:hypothetical protein